MQRRVAAEARRRRTLAPAYSSIGASSASPFMRRPVQRGHAVALRGVDVGALLQQRPHRVASPRIAASATGASARRRAEQRRRQRRARATSAVASARRMGQHLAMARASLQTLAAAVVARRRRSDRTPPVLSPKLVMSSSPSLCSSRQHRVGHRRAVGRLEVQAALQRAAGVAGEEQRAALVVVHVRVAHRRAVDDQRVVEQVARRRPACSSAFEEVRQQADVVLVDLRELGDAVLAVAVVRRGVERRR